MLIGAPLVVFALPALAGYPLLTGDDVIQNYPLRVLAGEILRHGHLPVYDPFEWSGAALLGGINAGAAFPAMVLFVVLPPLAAWVATETLAYAAAAAGLFAFLRLGKLRPLPAALGGAAFGLAGFVSSQAVHIDVVEACASLAWLLVGLDRVAHGSRRARPGWVAFTASAAACLGLAGSPEAAFYAAVGGFVYAAHLVLHARGRRWTLAGTFILAGAIGVLLAGVQILPGAQTVLTSQRADVGTSFLTAGSLDGGQLLTLLAPHLLGGGPIGLRSYVGSYNLGEIDAYPGMLALVATAALATRWRAPGAERWRVWYLVGGLGLLVALGKATPLPHLLAHLPVIGSSRLPSRALVLYALASSALLGHWANGVLDPSPRPPPGPAAGRRADMRAVGLAGALPAAAVLTLVVVVATGGAAVARLLAGGPIGPWTVGAVAPYLVIAGAVACAAGCFSVLGHRLEASRRAALLVGIALADTLLFTADQSSLAPIYARAVSQPNALSRALASAVGPGGRFAVVDAARSGGIALDELGAPDLNGLSQLPSAQGYGSLVWGPYAAATGTHGQDVAAPAAIAGTVFDSLGVRALLVTRAAFELPARAGHAGTSARAVALGLRPGSTVTRYFGTSEPVTSVTLRSPAGLRLSPAALRRIAGALGLVDDHGRAERAVPHTSAIGGNGVEAAFPPASRADGLVISDPLAEAIPRLDVVVGVAGGRQFVPAGPLAFAAAPPHWRLEGAIGPYAVLHDTRAAARYSVAPTGTRAPRATVHEIASSPWDPTETVAVHADRAFTLVRSVADVPGWSARVLRASGGSAVPVRRDGLVQSVALPAGRYEVTFTYTAPGLRAGLVASAAGGAALLVLLALDAARRGRCRGRRRLGGAGLVASLALLAVVAAACGADGRAGARRTGGAGSARVTSTTQPASGSRPARRAPGAGIVPGRVTAIGDSVMLDYSALLAADLSHAAVKAAVGRQWRSGIALVRRLRATGSLGATVVVALGTNGPVTAADLTSMMAALSGARRIVLVTVHVDQPWQAEVNAVLRTGARRYRDVVVADWSALATRHPGWFYADRTHLPIGGPGARALAALVARAAR